MRLKLHGRKNEGTITRIVNGRTSLIKVYPEFPEPAVRSDSERSTHIRT